MEPLIIILVIRLVFYVLTKPAKSIEVKEDVIKIERVYHPAEFELRWE